MEHRSRRLWISVVFFSRPVALKFDDKDIQFLFRQVTQVALRQIGAGGRGVQGFRTSSELRVPAAIGASARSLAERTQFYLANSMGAGSMPANSKGSFYTSSGACEDAGRKVLIAVAAAFFRAWRCLP
jgi:hypothetical protein